MLFKGLAQPVNLFSKAISVNFLLISVNSFQGLIIFLLIFDLLLLPSLIVLDTSSKAATF